MLKLFDRFKNESANSTDKMRELAVRKSESLRAAKEFAGDMDSVMCVFKQFFKVAPIIGTYGRVDFTPGETTLATMGEGFLPGYTVSFCIDDRTHDVVGVKTEIIDKEEQ